MSSPGTEGEEANRLESLALAVIFSIVSLALLLAIGVATRAGSSQADWWTRPAFAPAVALSVLAGANALTLLRGLRDLRARPPTLAERAEARERFAGWLRPVEFLAYYAVYVWAIRHVGYFPASLLFVSGLLVRSGLGQPRWLLWGFAFCLALVGVFRIGLGVWMPAPALYELFPGAVRSVLLRWF
jgi:hypothetical protein